MDHQFQSKLWNIASKNFTRGCLVPRDMFQTELDFQICSHQLTIHLAINSIHMFDGYGLNAQLTILYPLFPKLHGKKWSYEEFPNGIVDNHCISICVYNRYLSSMFQVNS